MFIAEIKKIDNYRNLSELKFEFDKTINFIVGENNIGKTNVMELMNKLIKSNRFEESDFKDTREPIKVVFSIKYTNSELGFFENIFDVDDEYVITITATQDSVDGRIEYCHTESEAYINPKNIKMLNFIYYSSLRTPTKELSFNNNIGTGKVLKYIMKKSLENKDIKQMDLLKQDEIGAILTDVNGTLEKLNGLSAEKIEAFLSDDNENIINRILEIGDTNKRNISKLGDGLQYSFNIFLNILDLLVHLKTTKKEEVFESLLFTDSEGKKYLPLVLGLDEPEVHQHPYRQRALVKSILNIVNNKNVDFIEILQQLFGIDGFIGQVFIATHSPNILLNDYKQITRLYYTGDGIDVTCGKSLSFEDDVKKHLIRSFMYFKEAMFADAVILVEGDTEYGAMPIFEELLEYNFDEEGVGVVKLDGADAVLKYLELFNAFDIYAVAILDRDKEDTYTGNTQIFFTTGDDYEVDIFDEFTFKNYLEYLESIGEYTFLIQKLTSRIPDFDATTFALTPFECEIPEDVGVQVMAEIRENEIKRLRKIKNAVKGAELAKFADAVPDSFKAVIEDVIWGE